MRACDYNVYQIRYTTIYAERTNPTGMDSELTGKYITEERRYYCVAPNQDLAKAAFLRYHSKDEILDISNRCQLDDLVYLQ